MMPIVKIVEKYENDPGRLMDILHAINHHHGYISEEALHTIAAKTGISVADVEQTRSFYHFFGVSSAEKYSVYLNNSAVSIMNGCKEVASAFEKEAGCSFGSRRTDGLLGLHFTADIGMNDQEPAALINGTVFPRLTPERAQTLVRGMFQGKSVQDMVAEYGDPVSDTEIVEILVQNNLRKMGPVIFSDFEPGKALQQCISRSPEQIVAEIKRSNLRGRGGAGFPTGLKWEFCQRSSGTTRYVLCNADEGEPGTFKDRVILSVAPYLLFEGMAIAGYAIGASEGYLYLRWEYQYLLAYLESILKDIRQKGYLGKDICGKKGFDFDIRIQLGAGAYVCGEESAMIESMEGHRGEPRIRPPFPAEKGYKNNPTIINNVETLCAACRIIEKGAAWFSAMGTEHSTGTKVLSISGDCEKPGVYEIEWGMTINDLLGMVKATDVQAVQIGGPSGICIDQSKFNRKLCFTDLATGGSIIVISKKRNLLHIVKNFTEFFAEESCGSCVPCRAGTIFLMQKMEKILAGHGVASDIEKLLELGSLMKTMNRCGLGQTAAQPIVTTIQNFRHLWEAHIDKEKKYDEGFDLARAVKDSCAFVDREPALEQEHA